jgi:hypothetical protein
MPHPPTDYHICPCCGTEFGLDDISSSHEELRNNWLLAGAPWFSQFDEYRQPENWNAWDQVGSAGYAYDVVRPLEDPISNEVVQLLYAVGADFEPEHDSEERHSANDAEVESDNFYALTWACAGQR